MSTGFSSPAFRLSVVENSTDPAYLQICRQVEAFIREHTIPEGTRLPDIQTLAEQSGVSLRTMDRALDLLIANGVCVRRPKRGTFVSSPSNQKQRNVCCLVAPHGVSGWPIPDVPLKIYSGLLAKARTLGVDVITVSDAEIAAGYRQSPDIRVLGGVVECWEDFPDGLALARRHASMLFVLTNYEMQEFATTPENVRGVFNDDRAGAYQAVSELVRRGFKRIAAITLDTPDVNYSRRITGFQDALAASNGSGRVHVLPTELHDRQGEAACEAAIRIVDEFKPDAFFCVNDHLGEGVDQALAKIGATESIELIGYDNLFPEISAGCGFTTMSVDYAAIGSTALDVLMEPERYPKTLRISPALLPRWRATPRG